MSKKQKTITRPLACLIFLLAVAVNHHWPAVKAVTVSPTPEASPAAEETIDEKVQGIREAVKEKVQEKLLEVSQGLKRAFVGQIIEINESSLLLKTREGEREIQISEETTVLNLNRKEIDLEDLETDVFVIAMGYLGEEEFFDARRVVVIEEPQIPARMVAFGRVTDQTSDGEKILTVKQEKKETIYEVEVVNTTKITKKMDDEVEKINFDEIEAGDRLVAIGKPTGENGFLTAKLIHIIPASSDASQGGPGEATGQEKETPTPSPTPEVEEE